jgi:uncharacterized protein
MIEETHELLPPAPGHRVTLTVLRFGPAGGRSATLQAALHADEVPAMLVAQALRRRLAALEAEGALRGEIRLVPYANPIGLAQRVLGQDLGRFDLRDGLNFNRDLADLTAAALKALGDAPLGADAAANVARVRRALAQAAAGLTAGTTTQDLKRRLLQTAIDSEIVLDLHCDGEAAMHLYAPTPQAALAAELGALLGARAVLLAVESGDQPFDEACSRPWTELAQRLAPAPLPPGCFSATVELRGQADTDHALAEADAAALVEFLRRRGLVAGTPAALPAALCEPTPLAGSEPITAPRAGVVVFRRAIGDVVQAGDVVLDIVDVHSGELTPVAAQSGGVLYARSAGRWAHAGQRLAKVAGTLLSRTGKLLSP